MKKIITVLLSVLILAGLTSCFFYDETKVESVEDILTLIEANEPSVEGKVEKYEGHATVDTSMPGISAQVNMDIVMYSKKDGANSVMSSETIVKLPGQQNNQEEYEYFKDGYLYTSDGKNTYKEKTSFEEATGDNSNDDLDYNELLENSLTSSYEVKENGCYSVLIDVDTTAEMDFLKEMIDNIGYTGVDVKKMSVQLDLSSAFVVTDVIIKIEMSMEYPQVGTMTIKYDVNMSRSFMPEGYEIKKPSKINIENAKDSAEGSL